MKRTNLAVLVACLAAPSCGNPNPNPDGSPGGDAARDVPLSPIVVEITAPATSEVWINAPIAITCVITGGTPDRVDILKEALPVATLAPPSYTYMIPVAPNEMSHSTYRVRARRGTEDFYSAEKIINVDTIPPLVMSMGPTTPSLLRDPVKIVFSEPMAAEVMRVENFQLNALTTPNTVTLPLEFVASQDQTTATVQAKGPWLGGLFFPSTPVQLSMQLRIATDRAGNRVAQNPIWNWDALPWKDLAPVRKNADFRATTEFDVRTDSFGKPVAVWNEQLADNSQAIYVGRMNDGGTMDLLDPNGFPAIVGRNPQLAIGASDAPIVAWFESGVVKVRKWNNTSSQWEVLGVQANPLMPGGTPITVTSFSLSTRRDGNPIVAMNTGTSIYLRAWNGTQWSDVDSTLSGLVLSPGQTSITRAIVSVDPMDRPALAILGARTSGGAQFIQFQRWSGTAWVKADDSPRAAADSGVVTAVDATRAFALDFDNTSTPVIASTTGSAITVSYAPNGTWTTLPTLTTTGNPVLRVDRVAGNYFIGYLDAGALVLRTRNVGENSWSEFVPAPANGIQTFAMDIRRPASIVAPAMAGQPSLLGPTFIAPVVITSRGPTMVSLTQASR